MGVDEVKAFTGVAHDPGDPVVSYTKTGFVLAGETSDVQYLFADGALYSVSFILDTARAPDGGQRALAWHDAVRDSLASAYGEPDVIENNGMKSSGWRAEINGQTAIVMLLFSEGHCGINVLTLPGGDMVTTGGE
jgi:hypothetical protein